MKEGNIKTADLAQIRAFRDREKPFKQSDGPVEKLPIDFWKDAKIEYPQTKASVNLRIDRNILAYFKAQGKGHLTRMNAVLKAYVEAQNRTNEH